MLSGTHVHLIPYERQGYRYLGCVCFLHTPDWCPTRASNPQETDFESVMSANCINRTFGTPTAARTLNRHFRRVLHFQLCYRSIYVRLKSRRLHIRFDLAPAGTVLFCSKPATGTRGGSRTLKRPGSLVRRIRQFCYTGIYGACYRIRTDTTRGLSSLTLPLA